MNGRDADRVPTAEAESIVQMIGFTIGSEHFGVKIVMVQEIIMIPDITEIPNSPDFVEGVINRRGDIIPVLDLRKRLRLRRVKPEAERKPGGRILLVEIDGNITGFIVDSVSKVHTIPTSKWLPPPDIIVAGVQSQYISGVVHLEDKILVILDFRKILSIEEKDVLDRMAKVIPERTAGPAQERSY